MNKIYYNENNVGLVNYTGGGSADIPSAFTSWEYDDYGRLKDFVLKDSVTSIPMYYQYYNTSLTSCTIPSSVTSIDQYAFAAAGYHTWVLPSASKLLDISSINLSNITPATSFTGVFSSAVVKGNITIPNSLLSGSSSGYSSTCYGLFDNAKSPYIKGTTLTLNVYADNVIIPRNMFHFSNSTSNSDGLRLTIHGTPTFLSKQSFSCTSGGTVTFADCTNPPAAESYGTASSSPFYNFNGTLYVPAEGLTAWKNKYTGIASKIKAIGT